MDVERGAGRGAGRAIERAVSIVGPSDGGKTTLVGALIAELERRGLRCAAVKHTDHPIELDAEGTDTWRHRGAGASPTVLVGQRQLAVFAGDGELPDLADLLELVCHRADVVIVEGFRSAGLPSIVVGAGSDDGWERPMSSDVVAEVGGLDEHGWPSTELVRRLADRIAGLARSAS